MSVTVAHVRSVLTTHLIAHPQDAEVLAPLVDLVGEEADGTSRVEFRVLPVGAPAG